MIDQEYLEKYCIDQVNSTGSKLRKNPNDQLSIGRMNAFSEVLMIIAQAVAYEDQQVCCSNEHDSIVKDRFRK